jgi:hypothetical protein
MSIRAYMVDTVTVVSVAGRSNAGDPVFGPQREISARVEDGGYLQRDSDGNELQAQHVLATEDEIKITDRLWLPGDDTSDFSASRRPLTVRYARTRTGTDGHYEVSL